MYPIVWYALITVLSVLYAQRAKAHWGRPSFLFIDWPLAIMAAVTVMATSFAIAKWDMADFAHVSLFVHSVGVPIIIFAGLVAWRTELWWLYVAACLSLVTWSSYVVWEDTFSNLLLVATALGISLCGRYSTTRGFVIGYLLLAAFDIYAVLGTDIMKQVMNTYPGPFPTALEIVGGANFSRGLGAGDVIFTAIACQHIFHHRGVMRAYSFVAVCSVSVFSAVAFIEMTTPLLVVISPLAFLFLLVPKGFVRIE